MQYDKTRFDQEGADFQVVEKNKRGQINYQGGHLIDHKYSAGNSHTTEENYFPQHHKVNTPLKEYLVQHSEEYVEILLYTSAPPTVGVKGKKEQSHPIPVGDVFVQINQGKITNVYYFPNNDFDYENLKERLKITKDVAKSLLPYFKLKPCFHALFQSAIVTDFRTVSQGKQQQTSVEQHFLELVDSLSDGMTLAKCNSDEAEISALAFKVLHEEGNVKPSLLLDCDETMLARIQDESLNIPFKTLGDFLVKYCIRNALKSEVISTYSRLIFLNVIIDFIENSEDVTEPALDFVDSLAPEFEKSFNELEKIRDTMNQRELFYYADTYRRLSSKFNHACFSTNNYKICFLGQLDFLYRFVAVLEQITQKYPIQNLTGGFAQHFLFMVLEAQDTIDYWIEQGAPKEMFELQLTFLENIKDACLKLFDRQPAEERVCTTFQSNIKATTSVRTSEGYTRSQLEDLGLLADTDDEYAETDDGD